MIHLWLRSSRVFLLWLEGNHWKAWNRLVLAGGAGVPALWVSALVSQWYLMYHQGKKQHPPHCSTSGTLFYWCYSLVSDLISPAVVGWKLVLYQPMFCLREYTIYIRCSILCTNEIVFNGRKHIFIQNYRNVNSWKCKIKTKFNLGCSRIRLEGGQCDFKCQ